MILKATLSARLSRGKTPLLTADLIRVLAHLPSGLAGVRDRALLLVGYTGGLRRSELAAFTVEDLAWVPERAVLTLRRSKTDQAGQGRKVALPRGAHAATCPVTALRQWLEEGGIVDGALFREVDRHGKVGEPGFIGIPSEASSNRPSPGRGLIRRGLRGTHCGRSLRPRPPAMEPAPSTLCARPGTAPLLPCHNMSWMHRSPGCAGKQAGTLSLSTPSATLKDEADNRAGSKAG